MKTRNIVGLFSILIATQAHAAPLNLQGTVNPQNDITINAVDGAYNALNIVSGQSNLTIANVTESSNNLSGYKINMSSSNGGELRNTSDVTKKTNYTISYGGGTAVQPTTNAAQVKSVSSLNGLTTASSAVKINVTAFANAPAGTYTDQLTLAIVANP